MKVIDLLKIVVVGGAALFAYDIYKSRSVEPEAPPPVATPMPVAETVEDRSWIKPRDSQPTRQQAAPASSSRCDGRTSCPQMRSCEEAKYFIQHCPNTKMDGDRDGIPCEEQWCGH